MANYLQRFLSKWKYAIITLLVISAIGETVSFQTNRWFPNYALSFCALIAQQTQTKISYKTVYYRFPNYIILKEVKISSTDEKAPPMLQASRVVMRFSYPLFSPDLHLSYIILDGMVINFPVLKNYWALHGKKIYAWVKNLPKGSLRILIPNGQLLSPDHAQNKAISFKTDLDIDQDNLSAHGFWNNQGRFDYELNGNIRESGFDLDKFTLRNGPSSMNLWGSWYGNSIDWKGFIFYDSLYILDIEGHLKIQQNDIILKQLSFTVDGDAIGASGQCSNQKFFQCDADIAYWRGAQHLNALEPLKNINLHLHAQNSPQGLVFNGATDLYFLFDPDSPTSLQSAHLDFEDLKAHLVNNNFLELKIKEIQSILSIQGNEHRVPLKNILASFNFARPYQKIIALSANLFAGHGYSRIFLDTASLPWQIKSQSSFSGIDINQLSNAFPYFKQSHGLLSGNLKFQSSKDVELSGILTLHNGDFKNTDFLSWISKILQMPSLEYVSGADLSCRFNIDRKSKMLDDVKLNTDDFDLNGFFHLDADNLVSSQASVRFSQKLLSESPIGRKIIGLVRGAWTLPFEFSLSGNMYGMNFQWDSSPLKDKVRQHMFSFFERMIDRRMNAQPYHNFTIQRESVSPG